MTAKRRFRTLRTLLAARHCLRRPHLSARLQYIPGAAERRRVREVEVAQRLDGHLVEQRRGGDIYPLGDFRMTRSTVGVPKNRRSANGAEQSLVPAAAPPRQPRNATQPRQRHGPRKQLGGRQDPRRVTDDLTADLIARATIAENGAGAIASTAIARSFAGADVASTLRTGFSDIQIASALLTTKSRTADPEQPTGGKHTVLRCSLSTIRLPSHSRPGTTSTRSQTSPASSGAVSALRPPPE